MLASRPVLDEPLAVAVIAASPERLVEGIERLAGEVCDRVLAQQRADVLADGDLVPGPRGPLRVQEFEVAIHELTDRRPRPGIPPLLDLAQQTDARFLGSVVGLGPAGIVSVR